MIDEAPRVSMPGRWRLLWMDVRVPLFWLLVAIGALSATVVISLSPARQDRLAELPRAVSALLGQAPSRVDQRPIDDEVARLREESRRIVMERARLELRVVQLERGLEDVTGTVRRDRETAAARVASGELTTGSIGRSAVDQPPIPAAAPSGTAAPAADLSAGSVTLATRTQFGVDLGTETTLTALRGRWQRLVERHPTLLTRMEPIVTVRDAPNGLPALHLVAGPVADVADAAALCARLRGAGLVLCQPTPFDGQRLALR